MLEKHEWKIIAKAHNVKSIPDPEIALAVLDREASRLGIDPPLRPPPETSGVPKALWHLIAGYHMFTGVLEESPNPIWHHVVDSHGPPCSACSKPLRTAQALYCAACGVFVPDAV